MLNQKSWILVAGLIFSASSFASTPSDTNSQNIESFCKEWSHTLRTVKYDGCLELNMQAGPIASIEKRAIPIKRFTPAEQHSNKPTGNILFISGIHGDEYTAISLTYLWMMNMQANQNETRQNWMFFPLANPDGLFQGPATRVNANGVDINRNFPSPDWDELALKSWQRYKNKRRYPGESANSEPETQLLVNTIKEFKPDAIISIHAPYGLLDYDGPDHAIPNKIGALHHRELGTYPGSLGRYAGEYLNIPVLTLELRSAGSMPSQQEIFKMWRDVELWTEQKIQGKKIADSYKSKMRIIEQSLKHSEQHPHQHHEKPNQAATAPVESMKLN
ncbi:M14 family zinc carboxypeptidase [Thiomicrorhabdus sediminis]|uniref:Murein peptide amidase A n=1 Tax=Thiomicrorhabdus sediminis TaxID=2580412 RepID=A0A4P9K3X2_9GAMM|nr:M14 family zinc carboxypeptidase [Thiomicrorhabdus sediminis]QCU89578.1 murein peptide amidase A [Thiomicrorhabdus sediminis]